MNTSQPHIKKRGIVVQKEDGQLHDPPLIVRKSLAGFMCENDFCEAQLGDERQMLCKAGEMGFGPRGPQHQTGQKAVKEQTRA